MKENECLFLYTDGVTEAQTTDCEFFGLNRLLKILNKKGIGLPETLENIHKGIEKFINGAPQFDDITMMLVKFKRHK